MLCKKVSFFLFLVIVFSGFFQSVESNCYKVGLCIMATGKYTKFVKPLIDSAEKYFCKNHFITYFVFTDGCLEKSDSTIVKIYQQRLGWPHDTLKRFEVYSKHREQLAQMDYLFAIDADMLFVDNFGDEILKKRVATQHPGFVGKRGSYEGNSLSTACVNFDEGEYYFAGGFYGGSAQEFLKMAYTVSENIKTDLAKNYIAVWHDESHLNRYFIDNKPIIALDCSYCYPEEGESCGYLSVKPKLIALLKDHDEMRE